MKHKPPITPTRLDGITVLQVIPELETGGAERTTLEVARAIVAAGGRSLVVSEGGPMVATLQAEGSTFIRLPVASKNPVILYTNAQALKRLIRAEGVAIIHARSRAPAWSALWAARATGIRFVTTYHGIYRATSSAKRLYNSAMARGDRVIANSAYTASAVAQTYGAAPFFDARRMTVIPRGADLGRFSPAALTDARKAAALAAFGGADAIKVLLPGRLTSWKGQSVLVDAAKLLHSQTHDRRWHIVMIGSAQGRDTYEATLRRQIAEAGLEGHVHILGHWDDMPAAYGWADVTISASTRPEAFGRVAVEAQAMGCPVIATAHGGALETVADDVTGWLVPPGDPAALAEALSRFAVMSHDARRRMGVAARLRIADQFSVEAMTNATLSVYKALTSEAGQVGPQSDV